MACTYLTEPQEDRDTIRGLHNIPYHVISERGWSCPLLQRICCVSESFL